MNVLPATRTVHQVRPRPARDLVGGGVVLAGAAITIFACFLPWISVSDPFLTVNTSGIALLNGQVVAGLATLSALLGVLTMARRVGVVVPVVLLVLAGL